MHTSTAWSPAPCHCLTANIHAFVRASRPPAFERSQRIVRQQLHRAPAPHARASATRQPERAPCAFAWRARAHDFRQTEVGDFQTAIGRQEEVGRLQVPVNQGRGGPLCPIQPHGGDTEKVKGGRKGRASEGARQRAPSITLHQARIHTACTPHARVSGMTP